MFCTTEPTEQHSISFYCKTLLNKVMDVLEDEEDNERDTRND